MIINSDYDIDSEECIGIRSLILLENNDEKELKTITITLPKAYCGSNYRLYFIVNTTLSHNIIIDSGQDLFRSCKLFFMSNNLTSTFYSIRYLTLSRDSTPGDSISLDIIGSQWCSHCTVRTIDTINCV
jgi:hypothetical protein